MTLSGFICIYFSFLFTEISTLSGFGNLTLFFRRRSLRIQTITKSVSWYIWTFYLIQLLYLTTYDPYSQSTYLWALGKGIVIGP